MLEKFKISLLVWVGFLPTCSFYPSRFSSSYEGIFSSLFYLCPILFVFFMALFGILPNETEVTNLFVIENEHHQIKFKTDGHCVLRETCCHSEKYSYAYGEYKLKGDTILLDGKVFNRKDFKTFAIKGKRVRLISKDEKRNDYFTFEIVEDNRTTIP
ncbi:hypothetical protein [Bernardetia sp.]|uniref:hypothetical protein n=1 Tax=Bernardetia sp. TaxID=1937974 RepID=UPI0025C24572|nr:hypothetical protein [Bernardetia sp.]